VQVGEGVGKAKTIARIKKGNFETPSNGFFECVFELFNGDAVCWADVELTG